MNIYTLLQTKTDFTTSEKIIAKYILENPEKVIHMSAQEISEPELQAETGNKKIS